MGKALKGDSPEVGVVLTRHSQRHAVIRPGARLRNKVYPTTVMKLLWDFAYVTKGSYT